MAPFARLSHYGMPKIQIQVALLNKRRIFFQTARLLSIDADALPLQPMKKDVFIREALPTDAHAVLALIQELATFERAPDAVFVQAQDLIDDGFGPNPAFTCFVAEHQQEVVGMALGYPRYSTWEGKSMHLEDLIVSQSFRGMGIGFSLYKTFIHHAAKQGARRIEWAVLDWNQSAIDFYEKTGAQLLPEWRMVQMDKHAITDFITQYPNESI